MSDYDDHIAREPDEAPCGESGCVCRCTRVHDGAACGCDCPHPDDCDCLFCIPGSV